MSDDFGINYPEEKDLTPKERLLLIEREVRILSKNQTDLEKQFQTGFTSLEAKFDLYVRLERYKIVELAVFGVIGLMTTAVIVALLAVVIKGVP